jgi:hypothetical protein
MHVMLCGVALVMSRMPMINTTTIPPLTKKALTGARSAICTVTAVAAMGITLFAPFNVTLVGFAISNGEIPFWIAPVTLSYYAPSAEQT